MSIPEVPPDGEPRARQEGAWVLTYGKAVLDQFIADIRAMLEEMRQMYDDFMNKAVVLDAPDNQKYVRTKGSWVPAPIGGGGGGENFAIVSPQFAGVEGGRIYLVNIADYPGVTHLWIDPPDDYAEFPGSMVVVNMPYVTGDAHLAITISPNWTIREDDGTLYNWITVMAPNNPELGEYTNFNSLDGGPNCSQMDFLARHTYQAAARNGVWQLSDAIP